MSDARQFFQFQRSEEACEQHEANTNGNNNNKERILEEKSQENNSSLEQPAKKVCTKMPDDFKELYRVYGIKKGNPTLACHCA